MFLAWNYTLELFFWIVLGAIILISLTILLAGPRFRSKKPETSEETLLLTGESVNSPKGKILDQDTASGKIEEELEILEENKKNEVLKDDVSFYTKMKVYGIIFLYILYSFFVSIFGVLILYIEIEFSKFLQGDAEGGNFFTLCFGIAFFLTGLLSLYGFLVNNEKWTRNSCRTTAVLFFLIPSVDDDFLGTIGFTIVPLLFSGDFKRIWKWMTSNEEEETENENKEKEVTSYMEGKAAAVIFGYSLFSLLIFYIGLAWTSHIESDPRELDKIFSFLLKCLLLINGFTLYYGFYQNNTDVLKISGRIVAFIFFIGHEDMNMGSSFETSTFFLLGLLALLFSGDLKRIWKWMTSNKEEDVTQFGKWVENILKLLREKWMTLNTYTGIRYLLYLFFFLSVILFLAVFIFQFF